MYCDPVRFVIPSNIIVKPYYTDGDFHPFGDWLKQRIWHGEGSELERQNLKWENQSSALSPLSLRQLP